jgi:hypothetical protein
LHVTLRKHLEAHAPGLTPREVLATLSGILMLDVHLPLADERELVLPRYTQPEPEQRLVLEKLGWELLAQPPPRIRSAQAVAARKARETKSKLEWRPLETLTCKSTPYASAPASAMKFGLPPTPGLPRH